MTKTYKDLREFLDTLEQEGQLIRVKEEVDPEPDIGAAGRAAANMKNSPAIKNSAIPLCFGCFRNVAASCDFGWRVKKRLNGIMFILAQEVRK